MKKTVLYCSIKTAVFTAVLLQFPTVLLQYLCSKCSLLDTKILHTAEKTAINCSFLFRRGQV